MDVNEILVKSDMKPGIQNHRVLLFREPHLTMIRMMLGSVYSLGRHIIACEAGQLLRQLFQVPLLMQRLPKESPEESPKVEEWLTLKEALESS
jgi:hypothetical protein